MSRDGARVFLFCYSARKNILATIEFFARLDEVQEELLYYPRRMRWRRR